MIRNGIGYDVHRLAEGRKLILGGVEIKHSCGLEGHSDADVLSHAIADALLGAIAAGDIGQHFPNTDESIRGISSIELLKRVAKLLADKKARANNVDASIIAETPKLAPYIPMMRTKIAQHKSHNKRKTRRNRPQRRYRRDSHCHRGTRMKHFTAAPATIMVSEANHLNYGENFLVPQDVRFFVRFLASLGMTA
jgi:2-C-methyl-D-erythritol 2,4-cyclodiphosphate synthase